MKLENDKVGKLFIELRNKCIDEIQKTIKLYGAETNIGGLIVSKVRDYNREWNKICESRYEFKKDGFLNVLKKELKENCKEKLILNALEYL